MTEDQFDRRPGPGAEGRAARAGAPPGQRPPAWGEEQVRALLHRAVDDLQPDVEALPRIRRAVPARRARHRQAWTGALLIAVVSAAAVPTLGHLGGLQLSDGSGSAPSSAPGSTETSTPTAARPPGGGARPVVPLPVPDATSADPSGTPSLVGSAAPSSAGSSVPASATGAPIAASAGQAAGTATGAPACVRADLGGGQATVGTADKAGWVYGAFTVANVSGHPCLLTDPGTLTATLGGGSPGASVQVLVHAAGDPATGLPAPASGPGQLLLGAGAGYRLPFAFAPDTLCPVADGSTGTGGGTGAGPTPTPSASAVAPASSTAASPTGGASAAAGAQAGAAAGTGSDGPANPPTTSAGAALPAGSGAAQGAGAAAPAGAAADGPATGTTPVPPPGPPSPSATPTSSATAGPGTVTVTHRPLSAAPDAATATIPGVCGGGTLYRAAPQPS